MAASEPRRLAVPKTYKLYLNGAFPRSESGRSLPVADTQGRVIAHLCLASRKDLRDAVSAAAKAGPGWARRDAYNRGQVLYRMAEMLEGKAEETAAALASTVPGGLRRARKEVSAAVDRLVCFAGWADKYSQVLGNSNPVAGPYYNFTVPEPSGVIGVVAPAEEPLLALVSLVAPPLCAGCTVVALGSQDHPLATALFGEVCATSDLPAGSVNLLTGKREELLPVFAGHREIIGLHAAGCRPAERQALELGAAENVKRVTVRSVKGQGWYDEGECHSPYWIEPFLEMKTIWHPSAC
ncbi:MAG: aldehyde dehydrogenase family protein [Planctomycetes bacterium]|nr:aldehyde dehydrogenase family protein [Planctomycetota bacterium]